ncbi:hypothetical protein [Brevibacillus borstelensis]|uniref:hypothetical protein n=1 Tax=Brevibacillus borstelensis TaxID=45462 RepID=UPI003D2002D9
MSNWLMTCSCRDYPLRGRDTEPIFHLADRCVLEIELPQLRQYLCVDNLVVSHAGQKINPYTAFLFVNMLDNQVCCMGKPVTDDIGSHHFPS